MDPVIPSLTIEGRNPKQPPSKKNSSQCMALAPLPSLFYRPSSWRRSFGLDASQSDVPFQRSSENRRLRIFTVAHLPLHLLHRKSWPHLQLSKHRAWPSQQRKRPPQRQRRTTTEQSRPIAPTRPTPETLLTPPIPNWPRPTPLSPLNIHQIISPVSSAGRKKMSIFEDIESVKKEEQILSETKN